MRLGGEVFEEQRIHRALEADMQLGDFALGQRDDFDTALESKVLTRFSFNKTCRNYHESIMGRFLPTRGIGGRTAANSPASQRRVSAGSIVSSKL